MIRKTTGMCAVLPTSRGLKPDTPAVACLASLTSSFFRFYCSVSQKTGHRFLYHPVTQTWYNMRSQIFSGMKK